MSDVNSCRKRKKCWERHEGWSADAQEENEEGEGMGNKNDKQRKRWNREKKREREGKEFTNLRYSGTTGSSAAYFPSNKRLGKACQQPNCPSNPLTRIVSREGRATLSGLLSCQG